MRIYSTQLSVRVQHFRGIWGHAPPGKYFEIYESASEAVVDHPTHTKFMATGV